jgi:uncharacterized protein (TIRG00374 family)
MKSIIWHILRICVTILLFVLLFRPDLLGIHHVFFPVDLSELWQEIKGLSTNRLIPWMILALLIKAVGMGLTILRWHLLLMGQGIRLPNKHLISAFLEGRFIGTFMPSTVGLDGYRAWYVAHTMAKTLESITVILVEKVTGFFALSILVLVTLPFGIRIFGPGVLWGLAIFLMIPVIISSAILWWPGGILKLAERFARGEGRISRTIRKAADAVARYRGHRWILVGAAICGLGVHTAIIGVYLCTSRAIGAAVPITDLLFAAPIMIAATVGFPISVGGEGIREGTFVYLLGRVGVPSQTAFLFSHLGFWVDIILSSAGGVLLLVRPSHRRRELLEVNNQTEK